MFKRITNVLATWPFLLSLASLLLNDWYLKAAIPGIITGKISDFTGIAMVAMLGFALFPKYKHLVAGGIVIVFTFWKSPASESLISAINIVSNIKIGRTIDYGDLLALCVLPLCQRIVSKVSSFQIIDPENKAFFAPVGIMSIVAIMGSSAEPIRQEYSIRQGNNIDVPLDGVKVFQEIRRITEMHGLKCTEHGESSATCHEKGLTMDYAFTSTRAVLFQIQIYPYNYIGSDGEEVSDKLRASLKEMFSQKFKGLEYVEKLEPKRRWR